MYKIYTTHGIIIKIREHKETDKILSVFTKDFGRIEIFSKGTRNIHSKLRPHLDIFDYSRVSFIAGREFWRLTDAEKIMSFTEIVEVKEKFTAAKKIIVFLDKMLQGEEQNENLWNMILNSLIFLNDFLPSKEKDFKNQIKIFETILTIKILDILGYIDSSLGIAREILETKEFNSEFLKAHKINLKELESIINSGIKESGL